MGGDVQERGLGLKDKELTKENSAEGYCHREREAVPKPRDPKHSKFSWCGYSITCRAGEGPQAG